MPAAQDIPSQQKVYPLRGGAWYAAALDTGELPQWAIEAPLRETLGAPEHRFTTLRVYFDQAQLPPSVGESVRKAPGAKVWVTGRFDPPGGGTSELQVPLPEQVRAIEQLKGDPNAGIVGTAEHPPATTTSEPVKTSTLVLAVAGVAVVGGGAALLYWWATKPKDNPRRRRRKRRR